MSLILPNILDIPEKLLPIITELDEYRYFRIDGGRVSGKSQSVARFLLYLGHHYNLRILCGREIQNTIEESVYTIFADLIRAYNLPYHIGATKIDHYSSGSMIRFKGFREQGSVNIKGFEGVDILWIDEAQAITKETLDIIIPTIRAEKAKIFFTMNRTLPDDPVYETFEDRRDCLRIHIDYFENKHCPESAKAEAEECRKKDIEDYNHIWLGQPRAHGSKAAFRDVDNIVDDELPIMIEPDKRYTYTLGVDLAKSEDYTVLTILCNQIKQQHYWERMESENKTSWHYQKLKIKAVARMYNNALVVIDSSGVGDPITEDLMRDGVNVWHDQKEDSDKSTPGMKFTNISKENITEKLKVAIELKQIKIPKIKILIDELKIFEAERLPSGRYRYAAPSGKHDDCVISLALALWGTHDAVYQPDPEPEKEETSATRFWERVKKENYYRLSSEGHDRNLDEELSYTEVN